MPPALRVALTRPGFVPQQHVDTGLQSVPVLPGDGLAQPRQPGYLIQDRGQPRDLGGELGGELGGISGPGAAGVDGAGVNGARVDGIGRTGQGRSAEGREQADREARPAQADRAPQRPVAGQPRQMRRELARGCPTAVTW